MEHRYPPIRDRGLCPDARRFGQGIGDALGFSFLLAVLFGVLIIAL